MYVCRGVINTRASVTPGVFRKAAVRLQPLCRGMSWELTAALAQGVTTGGTVGWLRSSWLILLYSGDCLQTTNTQAGIAVGLPTVYGKH